MPLKTCPKCSKTTGPRAFNCPGCGHEYKKREEAVASVSRKPSKAEAVTAETPTSSGRKILKQVVTPSGIPPAIPFGYNKASGWGWTKGEHWQDQPSPEQIEEWANAVREDGHRTLCEYTGDAIKYFARYFWSISSSDYGRVCRIVDAWYKRKVVSPAS